ncbi:MAG: tRNA (adenosine(37)-N6)-threonylcarbamoyltransferase complex dimerization subunit type 1 TsaB [Thermomicrobia bacterium]|nr:tRNA (adenosine(37)-N6)-threonylcarbamoyltransferase complex dimerization subunit type 1 TsaB [Thermomicrobia bacterium]
MDATAGMLLALDTSSEAIGFAIAARDLLLAEASWRGQRRGTATLLAEAMRALEGLGYAQNDLRAVAVATGPGSFSGLRVGMGIAKGLALGLGIPIIGCPTLAITAEPFRVARQPVCATIAAGRGRFAYAVFAERDGAIYEALPARHGSGAEIGAALAAYPGAIVCGDLDEAAAAAIRAVAPGVTMPPAGVRNRRPGALAALAWRRILTGECDDLVALEPIYLHTSPPASAPCATKG